MSDNDLVERVAEAIRLRSIERGHPTHPMMVRHLAIAAIKAMDAWSAMIVARDKDKANVR